MANFFTDLISPNTGKSHKRVVSLLSAFTLIGISIVDTFAEVKINDVLVDGLLWLAIAGMGTATLERFAPTGRGPRAKKITETKTTVETSQPPEIT